MPRISEKQSPVSKFHATALHLPTASKNNYHAQSIGKRAKKRFILDTYCPS